MSNPASKKVVVAMSGGVDSSVAAALLLEQGYEVIGMMLRLWSESGREDSNRCCTPDSMASARRAAAMLDIPFYVLDVRETFYQTIVQGFIRGYAQGITPNPCLICNRQIRFGVLLHHATALGADFLATGHYARLAKDGSGRFQLLRGADPSKDQSYVLSVLNQEQLSQAIFPVGMYNKTEIRSIANRYSLPAATRSDSQDLCFLAGEDYRDFLNRHAPSINTPGIIVNRAGEILGAHHGLSNYTIGQRKGLGIFASKPHYVIGKQIDRNILVVGPADELGKIDLIAENVNWICGSAPEMPFTAQVKIRYQAREAEADVIPLEQNNFRVRFAEPLRDITPGQAAVFYQDEICLGGGIIKA